MMIKIFFGSRIILLPVILYLVLPSCAVTLGLESPAFRLDEDSILSASCDICPKRRFSGNSSVYEFSASERDDNTHFSLQGVPPGFFDGDFTVLAWIMPRGGLVDDNKILSVCSDGRRPFFNWGITDDVNRLSLMRFRYGCPDCAGKFFSNNPVARNKWTHVGLARKGADIIFYHNGVFDSKSVFSDGLGIKEPVMAWIGDDCLNSATSEGFNGYILGFSIFNRSLDESEINRHMRENRPAADGGKQNLENPVSAGDKDFFTVIVLPDTQKYSRSYPGIFTVQTEWIVENREDLNIKFVVHEGDVVDTPDSIREYDNANASLSILEQAGIPYSVIPGNHDHQKVRVRGKTSIYSKYFPASRFADMPSWGGNFNNNDNNFHLLEVDGVRIMFLNLDICPDEEELSWADMVAGRYPDRFTILTTHGYLDLNGGRNVNYCNADYIWENLVSKNPNIRLVLSGHMHGEAKRYDENDYGVLVPQILADYQDRAMGGTGWLRILKFRPEGGKIDFYTYTPYLDRYEEDEDSRFYVKADLFMEDSGDAVAAASSTTSVVDSVQIDESTTSTVPEPAVEEGFLGDYGIEDLVLFALTAMIFSILGFTLHALVSGGKN